MQVGRIFPPGCVLHCMSTFLHSLFMKRPYVFFLLVLILSGMSSCGIRTYKRNPYAGVVKNQFHGIKEMLDRYPAVNILVVHGMGPAKTPAYGDQLLIPRITRAVFGDGNPIPDQPNAGSGLPIELDTFRVNFDRTSIKLSEYKRQGQVLRFFAVHWSCATQPFKDAFNDRDSLVTYARNRRDQLVLFNEVLKRSIVNEGFADVMAYLGQSRDEIQEPVREAIRLMSLQAPIAYLRDHVPPTARSIRPDVAFRDLTPDNQDLLIKNISSPGAQDAQNGFAVISRSMGSKVVFDVVVNEEANTVTDYFAQQFCGRTHQMYMLANQVPLIGLADPEELDMYENMKAFIEYHRDHCAEAIDVVAFNDRYDLLTFELPDDLVPGKARIVNVQVANTPTVLSVRGKTLISLVNLFGNGGDDLKPFKKKRLQIADPLSAHENHLNNPLVVHMLANGYSGRPGKVNLRQKIPQLEKFPAERDVFEIIDESGPKPCKE